MNNNQKSGPQGGEGSRAATDWKAAAIEGDTFQWQVKVKLPLLAKLTISQEFDDLRGSEAPAKRTAYLNEVGGEGDEPSPAQQRALDFLVAEEASVLANVLRGAAESGNEFRQYSGLDESDFPEINKLMPLNMTPEQAAQRIYLTMVCVTSESRAGMAYLEIYGECAWETEHGLMVVLHGDRLVGQYGQGTGWDDPVLGK